ncbi:MAG: epoxide hydrolase [Pseudomonadales bacterium]
MIEPFKIEVEDEVLIDLNARLNQTRWPDQIGEPWVYGTDINYLKSLCEYWCREYDWRTQETTLNTFNHFKMDMDGRSLHFIHQRSSHSNALPLLMTHGWPGSISEFTTIIPMLTQPEQFGGDASDAFHVICPSIPGYGFSDAPTEPGFDQSEVARGHIKLMEQLGYDEYVVQGGDWGSPISSWTAVLAPERVRAMHLTLVFAGFPKHKEDPYEGVTDDERNRLEERRKHMSEGTGYQSIQGSKPQTLGYGLNDSPAGLAGWITEKFHSWTHHTGHLEDAISRDELLTNIMIYWVTQSITSSTRLYFESAHANNNMFADGKIKTPTGCTMFPGELYQPPRVWAEELYNVTYWNTQTSGGHFAALEQPALLTDELRQFFRNYR